LTATALHWAAEVDIMSAKSKPVVTMVLLIWSTTDKDAS
jgi:hypothetical protein